LPRKLKISNLLVEEYISEPGLHTVSIKKQWINLILHAVTFLYHTPLKVLQNSITRLSNLIMQSVLSQSLVLPTF